MTVKLLTEYHLEFLSLKGGFTGSSESTHVKMPHCWKSHVAAHLFSDLLYTSGTCKITFIFYPTPRGLGEWSKAMDSVRICNGVPQTT